MKRTILFTLLLLPAYICYAQEETDRNDNGEYGNRVPDAIVHLAKSIWLHFPKADKVHYNYKGRLIVNENDFELNLLVPLDSLSPSLKDSIEVSLSHEIPNATLSSMTRRIGQNGDSLSYSMAWLHGRQPKGTSSVMERKPGSVPSIYGTAIVAFDVFNQHAFLSFKFNNLRALYGLEEPQQEMYDVTGLDVLLDGLKRQYKTKKKKVVFPADAAWSTGIGYEYALICDAEKVYDIIRGYVGNEYLMKHTPLVSFSYFYDTDMMTIKMFKRVNEQNGGDLRTRLQEREIQICSRNGKLLILDVQNQNDRKDPCSIFSQWDVLLEGPDNHYFPLGKLTKQGRSTTLQIVNEVYRMKRKNRFSSTYIFKEGL